MKKKILVPVLALLLAVGVAGTFWGPSIAEAATGVWDSCPKGKVNDYYPGDCHDYTDSNGDDICDRSQSNPALATTTTSSVQSDVGTAPAATSTPIATNTAIGSGNGQSNNVTTSYHFLPVALVTLALYGLTWILAAVKKLKMLTHRKIWNVVLAVTMAGSALLGLIRLLVKDYNWDINPPFNVMFWHVEISIVLAVVIVFHIIWHWRYFAKMMGIGKGKEG